MISRVRIYCRNRHRYICTTPTIIIIKKYYYSITFRGDPPLLTAPRFSQHAGYHATTAEFGLAIPSRKAAPLNPSTRPTGVRTSHYMASPTSAESSQPSLALCLGIWTSISVCVYVHIYLYGKTQESKNGNMSFLLCSCFGIPNDWKLICTCDGLLKKLRFLTTSY